MFPQDNSISEPDLIVLSCLELMASAKEHAVKVDGIGTELMPSIIAFEGHDLIGYATLHVPPVSPNHFIRLLSEAAGMMVTGWHATGIAVVMESYAEALEPFGEEGGYDISLADRFATDPLVQEALWCAYSDRLGSMGMGVTMYKQTVGRIVEFGEKVLSDETQHDVFDEEDTLLWTIRQHLALLTSKPIPEGITLEECRDAVAGQIHRTGFAVYVDESSLWGLGIR
jgi:hypothetical protein